MSIYCKIFGHSASEDTLKLYLSIFYHELDSTMKRGIKCGNCGKHVILDLDKSRHDVIKVYEEEKKK